MFTDDQGDTRETKEEMSIEHKLDLILDEMRAMRNGFPKNKDGSIDYVGHREHHEKLIEAAEEQTKFWRELRFDIAKKGAWSLLTILCGLVMLGISAKFGIGVVVK